MTTKQKQQGRETAVIRAPHDGSEVGVVALAGPEDVRAALDANVAAARACREMPASRSRKLRPRSTARFSYFATAPKRPHGSTVRCCRLTSCPPAQAAS